MARLNDDKPDSAEDLETQEIQHLIESSPYAKGMGLRAIKFDPSTRTLSMRLDMRAGLERGHAGSGQFHGGAIASLVDIAGSLALMHKGKAAATVDLRVDYPRPAFARHLVATATPRKIGRTIAFVDVDVRDDHDRLVGTGRGTYIAPTE